MTDRVVIVQETLPHYRIEFFDRLRSVLRSDGIQLELVVGRPNANAASRRDQASLPWATLVRNRHLGKFVWQPTAGRVHGADLIVVEHANRHLLNYVLLARQLCGGRTRVAFWGHGANLQGVSTSLAERFKRRTATLPEWWFAYTRGSHDRVVKYGFPPERTTVVQNSLDTTAISTAPKPDREPFRCVYVGGLYEEKRLSFLMAAADHLAERCPEFRLTVIGDGPSRGLLQEARRSYLDYRGVLFQDAKAQELLRASLLLMPGLVGLAVIDSFAARTPIVTTAVPYHSPEFEYLESDRNGVVLPSTTTPSEYAQAVGDLLRNQSALQTLRTGCVESASRFTLDAMVVNFAAGIRGALETPRQAVGRTR